MPAEDEEPPQASTSGRHAPDAFLFTISVSRHKTWFVEVEVEMRVMFLCVQGCRRRCGARVADRCRGELFGTLFAMQSLRDGAHPNQNACSQSGRPSCRFLCCSWTHSGAGPVQAPRCWQRVLAQWTLSVYGTSCR